MGSFVRSVLLDLKDVTFDYILENKQSLRAVNDLSLQVEEGEYIALIGPNGSGKSTLARLLNALLIPLFGEIQVDGFATRV